MDKEMQMLLEKMKELKEQQQNDFIDSLIDMVSNFYEKVNKQDYTPTNYERLQLSRIVAMINSINERLK